MARRFVHILIVTALAVAGVATAAADSAPPAGAFPVSLTMTASAAPATGIGPGDPVTFTFVVTNHDNPMIPQVALPADPDTPVDCPDSGPIATEGTLTCTATVVATAGDVAAGGVGRTAVALDWGHHDNWASASAFAEATGATPPWFVQAGWHTSPAPVAGEDIHLLWSVDQVGSGALHDTTVTTSLVGASAVTCAPIAPGVGSVIPVGGRTECSASYTLTQADLDAGAVDADWQATTDSDEAGATTVSGTAAVAIPATPSLSVGQGATGFSPTYIAGDVIHHTITVTNNGTTAVGGIDVDDSVATTLDCVPALPVLLEPGEAVTCSDDHTVTQSEVDHGSIVHVAHAAGQAAQGSADASSTLTLFAHQVGALTVGQTATPASDLHVGDVVDLTVTATNSGTVTLHGVDVDTSNPAFQPLGCDTSTPATLAPGAVLTCTASATVAQDDVDQGALTNTAGASGRQPSGALVTATDAATVPTHYATGLALALHATPSSGLVAGDVVHIDAVATNTGDASLTNVSVTAAGGSPFGCTPSTTTKLLPAADLTCSVDHTVTQAEVDAGGVAIHADGAGFDRFNSVVFVPGVDLTAAADVSPGVSVVASTHATHPRPGQTITFDVAVANEGTVTLSDVTIAAALPGAGIPDCNVTPGLTLTLDPGFGTTCHVTYVVTQADADAGTITYAPTVTATTPQSATVTDGDTLDVTTDPTATLAVVAIADPETGLVVGDTTTLAALVANTGARTVGGVTVTNALAGAGPVTCLPTAGAALAAGATMTCAAQYTITQADFDHGAIVDPVTASGTDPDGAAVSATTTADALMGREAALDITGSMTPDHFSGPGAPITFTFTVTATGDLPVHGVRLSLDHPGLGPATCTPSQPASLARGGAMVCTVPYTVTQADIDAKGFTINATAEGDDPLGAATGIGVEFDATLQGFAPAADPPLEDSAPVVDDGATNGATFAFTGAESTGLAGVAVLAVLLGGGLLLAGRRRRTTG